MRHLRSTPAARPRVLYLSLVLVLNLLVVVINFSYVAWQGRYLFPALPALGVLLALGVEGLPRWSGRYTLLTVAGLGVANALLLGFVVTPAYWPAP